MRKSLIARLGAMVLLALLSLPAHSAVVIVNASTGSNSMSLSEVRAIFSMRLRRWENGVAVSVFVLKSDSPTHVEFCKTVLNVYPQQLQAAWDRIVYSGTGNPPTVVNSEEEMRAVVASTPGAIGYVSGDGNGLAGVKAVTLR
ncbi:MAG TPA: hypothetical protein VFM46_19405 [Pseudomonadales bacterium]|nr:hypothetical protein [Pseudomonadales bacterium]